MEVQHKVLFSKYGTLSSTFKQKITAKQFKYTKDNVYLTNEQRDFYEENGYIIIRNLVDSKLLDECIERFLGVCNEDNGAIVLTVMKDVHLKTKNVKGEFLINKIQEFLYDEVFFKYASYKPMIDIVETIIGPNITSFHSMLINKPPGSTKQASRHPLHQDLSFFPFRPAENVIACWTAMETINEQNGCLFVVPGSHKLEVMKHKLPEQGKDKPLYYGVVGMDHFPTVNLNMEKGDTVFFHSKLLHGSGPNLTKGFRKAISCHYADSNCTFVKLQKDIEKDIVEMATRRGFCYDTPELILIGKSRLIRGKPGRFQKISSQL